MAFTVNQREELINSIIESDVATEDEREFLDSLTDNQLVAINDPDNLDSIVDLVAENLDEEGNLVVNADSLSDYSDEELMAEVALRKKNMPPTKKAPMVKKPTGNSSEAVLTEEEWLKAAPESYKRLIANAEAVEAEQRDNLISTITANEQNTFTEEQLKATPIKTLEGLAKLAASRPEFNNYSGRSVSTPTTNSSDFEPLALPDLDWE